MSSRKSGFVKLWRSFFENEDFKAKNNKTNDRRILFLTILTKVNYKEETYNGVTLQPGEIIITHEKLAKLAALQLTKVKAHLVALKKHGMIDYSKTFQGTRIKVINWVHYQDTEQVTAAQTRNKPATSAKLAPTLKEGKKERKKEEYIETNKSTLVICEFFECSELNNWVGMIPKTTLKRWTSFGHKEKFELAATEAREYELTSSKNYKNIVTFLNSWFKRSDETKLIIDKKREDDEFLKYIDGKYNEAKGK